MAAAAEPAQSLSDLLVALLTGGEHCTREQLLEVEDAVRRGIGCKANAQEADTLADLAKYRNNLPFSLRRVAFLLAAENGFEAVVQAALPAVWSEQPVEQPDWRAVLEDHFVDAFRLAFANGHTGVARLLLEMDARFVWWDEGKLGQPAPKQRTVTDSDDGSGESKDNIWVLRNVRGRHLSEGLYPACSNGHKELVRELLALGGPLFVNASCKEHEAFHCAAKYGHVGIMQLLLAERAPANARRPKKQLPHWAPHPDRTVNVTQHGLFAKICRQGTADAVQLMLSLEGDRRIDVHADDNAAFNKACSTRNIAVVHLLLTLEGDRAIPQDVQDEHLTPELRTELQKYAKAAA